MGCHGARRDIGFEGRGNMKAEDYGIPKDEFDAICKVVSDQANQWLLLGAAIGAFTVGFVWFLVANWKG